MDELLGQIMGDMIELTLTMIGLRVLVALIACAALIVMVYLAITSV